MILDKSLNADGFVPLFNGKDLTGWKTHLEQTGNWRVENGVLIGSGAVSHLFSERGDYENFHFRIEAKINDGGNSGQYFRAQLGPGFPKGYEAQINATHRDPIKTGSLYPAFDQQLTAEVRDKIVIKEQLHKPDEWFTQEVIAVGSHITIKVNGQTTVDFVDEKNTFTKGHFALQQHGPVTWVQFRKIEIKELPTSASAADPDRRVAEWVLSIGGNIKIKENGQERLIGTADDLPRGAFELTSVGLHGNPKVSDAGLAQFKNCKNLTQLYLYSTKVSDAGLAHFKDCPNLTGLYLGGTQVSDAGLAHFKDRKNRTQLEVIYLEGTKVTDAALEHLAGLPKLRDLKLAQTKVTAAGVKKLAAALPECKIESDHGTFERTGGAPVGSEQKAAEWVLKVGGRVFVLLENKPVEVKTAAELADRYRKLESRSSRGRNVHHPRGQRSRAGQDRHRRLAHHV